MPRFLALACLLLLAAPAAASAGTYHVYTCAAGGKVYANNAWKAAAVDGVVEDASCAAGTIGLSVPAGARMEDNTSSALTFTSPAGTTIEDFSLTRQIGYTNPIAADTHKYFLLYSLGPTVFAGAGNYADPTRNALNAQKQWYGYPEGNVAVGKSTVSRASFPALAGYKGDANTLVLRVGCFSRGTPCSVDTGGAISHILFGSDMTINDPTAPTVTVEASGLVAGESGERLGPGHGHRERQLGHPARRADRRLQPRRARHRRGRGLHRRPHRRQPALRLQPARAVPEPQPRDRARDLAAGGAAPAARARDRHGRERRRSRPVPGVRRHAVRPRRGERVQRDRHGLALGDLDQGR